MRTYRQLKAVKRQLRLFPDVVALARIQEMREQLHKIKPFVERQKLEKENT